MASELTIFLKENVYPNIHAVHAGLLDDFHPKQRNKTAGKENYSLFCPVCGEKDRAYYYVGNSHVSCNRENNCGVSTSLWDIAKEKYGLASNKEVAEKLAELAGVKLPEKDGPQNTVAKSTLSILKNVLHHSLMKSKKAQEYLVNQRGWSMQEVEKAPFGYIASFEIFYSQLQRWGADMNELTKWGIYIEDEQELAKSGMLDFQGRLVGVWEEMEGAKLWGRLTRPPKEGEKKYKFQYGLNKDIPCFFNDPLNRQSGGQVIGVEGNIDAARLMVNGIPSVAVGGASISNGQAIFISSRTNSFTHWIDNDPAGLKGGVRTVTTLSELNVETNIINPYGLQETKDADDMMSQDGLEVVKSFIDERTITGGEFLTMRTLEYLEHSPAMTYEFIRSVKDKLIGREMFIYNQGLVDNNLDVSDTISDALRLFSRHYEFTLNKEEAISLVKRKTGVNLVEFFSEPT